MFIRRTAIKSRESGEPYYTHRLVESVRTAQGVRQHTVLNLGCCFEVPRSQWAALARRIEALRKRPANYIFCGHSWPMDDSPRCR